jgi:hypothetical protein
MAAPSAGFAAWRGGGGGGAHIGGGAHFAGGARVGGAPAASFARGPSASFAAAGPRTVAPAATTNWNGGRTAWNGGWRGDRYRGGAVWWPGAAAGAAVATGAALGAYAAYGGPYYSDDGYYDDTYYDSGYYDDGAAVTVVPAAPGGDASYCAQRFRSYDPASGTYLGYDGQRHPCP